MLKTKKTTALAALALLVTGFAVSACNTVEGVGQDTQSAGRAVERAADRSK